MRRLGVEAMSEVSEKITKRSRRSNEPGKVEFCNVLHIFLVQMIFQRLNLRFFEEIKKKTPKPIFE
jgi:hypothetical protein